MNPLDQVIFHVGLRDIPFGLKQEEVRARLGDPEYRDIDENGDHWWEYRKYGLSFAFWGDYDLRLGAISTQRERANVGGEAPIGGSREYVESIIENTLGATIDEDQDCVHENGEVQTWIEVASLDLTFWLEDGVVTIVEWGCRWENDRPVWASDD